MIKKEIRATIAREINSIKRFFIKLNSKLYHNLKKFFIICIKS